VPDIERGGTELESDPKRLWFQDERRYGMRMDKHVTLLGALFIAFHVIGLLVGIAMMTLLSTIGFLTGDPEVMSVMSAVGFGIGMFLILLSAPGIIAGIALLMRKRWGRVMALIVGAFDLLDIPLGTALGVYSFWVLLQDDTLRCFEPKQAAPVQSSPSPAQPPSSPGQVGSP
jgi:hypothetical protein